MGDEMLSVSDLISLCLMIKTGDREFILTSNDKVWTAAIGNKSSHVSIGEAITYGDAASDYIAEGSNAQEAMLKLYRMIAGYEHPALYPEIDITMK